MQLLRCPLLQWRRISRKQSARWQHLSILKINYYFNKFYSAGPSNELLTNFLKPFYKLLTIFLQISYERLTNFINTFYPLLTNFLQTSYKLHITFSRTSHLILTNVLETLYKRLTNLS
jgi:hypothetical protein